LILFVAIKIKIVPIDPINRLQETQRELLTKSIKSLDDIAFLLPKGIVVQAMICEAVHLQRFSFKKQFYDTGIKSIKDSKRMLKKISLRSPGRLVDVVVVELIYF